MDDKINPVHYCQGNVECIEALEACLEREQFVGYLRGQVVKYIWRLGLKDAPAIDAAKAQWYCDKLVEVLSRDDCT